MEWGGWWRWVYIMIIVLFVGGRVGTTDRGASRPGLFTLGMISSAARISAQLICCTGSEGGVFMLRVADVLVEDTRRLVLWLQVGRVDWTHRFAL
jgi:hypothetical protein